MNKINLALLFTVASLPIACATKKSEVATTFGFDKSSKVQAGPYQLHYARNDSEELLLLAEGNWNIISRTSNGTDVYLDGLPFINFDRKTDGTLTNLSMTIMDAHKKEKVTMVDRDADGQWDVKIDYVLRKTFLWKDDHWVERNQSQPQKK